MQKRGKSKGPKGRYDAKKETIELRKSEKDGKIVDHYISSEEKNLTQGKARIKGSGSSGRVKKRVQMMNPGPLLPGKKDSTTVWENRE